MIDFPGRNVIHNARSLVVLTGISSNISGVVVGWNVFTENNNYFQIGMWRRKMADTRREGRNIYK